MSDIKPDAPQGDVTIECDRCHQIIEGIRTAGMTGGFYDTSYGYWKQFANAGENNVCDECMHKDSRYRDIYGGGIGP